MRLLGVAVALFGILSGVVGYQSSNPTLELLAAASLVAAYCCERSADVSRFLKIFLALFTVETIVFGLADLSARFGFWPKSLADARLPPTLALTVAMFAIIVFVVSHVPVVRTLTRIADRFFVASDETSAGLGRFRFRTLERTLATGMVVFLVLLNQAQVAITVRLNFFNRDFFNAIQNHNGPEFWRMLLWVFTPWAFIYVGSLVVEYVVSSYLVIRWRRWLTQFYISHWLSRHAHYRMSLTSGPADNPDQRIAEDVARFIDGGGEGGAFGYGVYNYSIMLISTLSSLVSFAILLWSLSANFTFPGTNFAFPGLLFWVALIYAAAGTLVTHLIGRPLVGIMFTRQKVEADFRFSLARLREYSEQVALLNGEKAETISLGAKFSALIANYIDMINQRKKLTAFTGFYGQISPIIPYIFAAPFYFAKKIELGVMTQTAQAFGQVEGALTFFISYYTSLAGFRAVLDRLSSFDAVIEAAQTGQGFDIEFGAPAPALRNASVALPNGALLLKNVDLKLTPGRNLLVTGPSGVGKSTLFRALSGVWPFGSGAVALPESGRMMLIPQKPYLPIGTLREAVIYPAGSGFYDDRDIAAALTDARLPHLADKLDIADIWSQRLSGGEQQRIAIARALLARPDWLLLDEATAALDEETEDAIYRMLAERLPHTTLVSIGHRSTLAAYHVDRARVQTGALALSATH
ncbi:ABC transporter ATP-binding protein/permease [Rhodoblastus acidophilus]|uniref:ABC transporter ATP-binding protein/permease n=1 Tax=Candidatus Rhodoblastus alkanivorans TaxID=2954117 RepID=A0ABS9Z346_9HYPH|nr:ABC transporter ATP-binding protein/permease [Candidatus Rhodoblastus alkanivorans]MCI4679929.1 ABC transporter ATP-binding protein/permease [Candidatus Rhodoblastus alkanivorans]MCI4681496.1 ABC transporter ATP-binding protein/permease [Candidatus Rhodoblastus alkanivorans]MDI4642544.1 ABC transporter ATP-binding protein/permease [Rhodoblastus acidophilus]